MAYSICDEIKCPYAYKSGCDRYWTTGHCHLLHPQPGETRMGLINNEYGLFAEEADPRIDINELKDANWAWLEQDETTQLRVKKGFKPFDAMAEAKY